MKCKSKHQFLFIGATFSAVLLFYLGYLQEKGAAFLLLPVQWIIVAFIPFIIALLVGGYVTKIKGFGIEIEATLHDTMKASFFQSLDIFALDDLSNQHHYGGVAKGTVSRLDCFRDRICSIQRLIFRRGYNDYSTEKIKQYLEALPCIEFFEILSEEDEFICYIPVKYFLHGNNPDLDRLETFIKSLQEGDIKLKFSKILIDVRIKSDTNLLQALRRLREEGVTIAAVFSAQNKYLGAILASDIEKRIADTLLIYQK